MRCEQVLHISEEQDNIAGAVRGKFRPQVTKFQLYVTIPGPTKRRWHYVCSWWPMNTPGYFQTPCAASGKQTPSEFHTLFCTSLRHNRKRNLSPPIHVFCIFNLLSKLTLKFAISSPHEGKDLQTLSSLGLTKIIYKCVFGPCYVSGSSFPFNSPICTLPAHSSQVWYLGLDLAVQPCREQPRLFSAVHALLFLNTTSRGK